MRQGNLFVVSGPSGAGKGTLVKRIVDRIPDAWLSVSVTTRAPRSAEVDGVDYIFLSNEEFDTLVEEDGLIEWAWVHENRYGSPKAPVEQHLAAGGQAFLEIDVQGGFQIKELNPEAHLVFIDVPSLEELERRLRGRGTDSEESIKVRLENAKAELAQKDKYDKVFMNDDLDVCTEEMVAYIEELAKIDEDK